MPSDSHAAQERKRDDPAYLYTFADGVDYMKLSGDLRTLDATIQTLEEYEKKRQEIVAKVERLQVEEAALRAEIDSLQQEMRRIDCRPGQRA